MKYGVSGFEADVEAGWGWLKSRSVHHSKEHVEGGSGYERAVRPHQRTQRWPHVFEQEKTVASDHSDIFRDSESGVVYGGDGAEGGLVVEAEEESGGISGGEVGGGGFVGGYF